MATSILTFTFRVSDMPSFMTPQEVEAFTEVPYLSSRTGSRGSERRISVDPISLKESTKPQHLTIPLPQPSPNKLLSYSLPSSAASSPKSGAKLLSKKKLKNQSQQQQQPSPLSSNPLARQNSVALTNLERLREIHLRRSMSCGQERASATVEDLDVWFTKVNNVKQVVDNKFMIGADDVYKSGTGTGTGTRGEVKMEKFKCGACLFIPSFGKAKPVRARRDEPGVTNMGHTISRTVSLEKFECGSWTSSAIINDDNNDDKLDSPNLFFDLPIELIRCSDNDNNSPETAAFVFDKETKGVLKNGTTKPDPRKSNESTRHVRFSTSSPTSPTECITPRLIKAREDFNAFLEAQSA